MRKSSRHTVNKSSSVRQVQHNAGRVHILNMKGNPMRGGIRL